MRFKIPRLGPLLLGWLVLMLTVMPAQALEYPALSGRVVDNAQLLSSDQKDLLTRKLAAVEKETSNQFVVVTLSSLQGESIETFGVGLARHWGIGQKDKNNGVLLIVAVADRKVRIEVGYGLEGTLTDAQSSLIINQHIVPLFKRGKFSEGIVEGADKVIQVLGGKPVKQQLEIIDYLTEIFIAGFIGITVLSTLLKSLFKDKAQKPAYKFVSGVVGGLVFGGVPALLGLSAVASIGLGLLGFFLFYGANDSSSGSGGSGSSYGDSSSSSSSSSFSSSGFSGGGGSFGGGGASGSW